MTVLVGAGPLVALLLVHPHGWLAGLRIFGLVVAGMVYGLALFASLFTPRLGVQQLPSTPAADTMAGGSPVDAPGGCGHAGRRSSTSPEEPRACLQLAGLDVEGLGAKRYTEGASPTPFSLRSSASGTVTASQAITSRWGSGSRSRPADPYVWALPR